jgi:ATP-dependent 26S proteasome regulatory subunit
VWAVVVLAVVVQVDAIGGTRFDDGGGGDNEVQRTMLEIVNQLDGFDSRGNIKVRSGAADCRELSLLLMLALS